jgi:hypothetical protein
LGAGGKAQVVEHLPSSCKALRSTKERKRKKKIECAFPENDILREAHQRQN